MLLSLAVDTFRENKKNLLLWGAGLMLTVIFAAIFWPEDLVISSVMDADSSFGLGWQWHSFWKYLQIFLLLGYISIFSIVEGSQLLAGRTAIGRLTLLMAYPLRRWQLLAARVLYLLTAVAGMAVTAFLAGAISAVFRRQAIAGLDSGWLWFKLVLVCAGFALFATLLGAITTRPWVGMAGGLVCVLFTWISYLLALLFPVLGNLANYSLFYYLQPLAPLPAPAVWLQALLLVGGIIAVGAGLIKVFDTLDLE
jgi:ABC-type transport system involved in multi-copper enzyme maturation permease subunit